jgi:signal transduction histidine kinase
MCLRTCLINSADRRPSGFGVLLVLAVVVTGSFVGAQKQVSVLALYSTRPDAPAAVASDRVMQDVLAGSHPERLDYYTEHVDLARFPEASYQVATLDYFRAKYERRVFDVILANGEAALEFMARHRDELFPGTPIVFSTGPGGPAVPPNATGLVSHPNFGGTLDIAARVQPETRRVVVISGASAFDKSYESDARKQFRKFESRLTFEYLSGLATPELLRRVATLAPRSIIYYVIVTEDGERHRFTPLEVLDRVAAVANAPIYTWHSVGMNHGVVGGSLVSQEALARQTAELALRVMRGERAESIPVVPFDANVNMFDWRELRRWGIDERRLPSGSTVLYAQPSAWERYRLYILGGVSLIVLQAALIAGLLLQRAERRRTEGVLRQSQQRLEESSVEVRNLAGRLIVAQEAERSRIARELHDDVSQQLAGLSIALSSVRQRLRSHGNGEKEVGALTSLQQRAVALAESVRQLSHDLHPGVLKHAGVEAALSAHCDEFRQQHPIQVSFQAAGDFHSMGVEAKLCLYRVAQEALRNTAKHSGARHVGVRLAQTPEGAELTIADDGQGFDVTSSERLGNGLGLRSIRERVRQAGGTVTILAERHNGTTVQVRIASDAVTGAGSADRLAAEV